MISVFILCCCLLFLIACLVKGIIFTWRFAPPTKNEWGGEGGVKISIVIACKNEAHNLENLITSLKKIDYPKDCYEIIFVDDGSTDGSFEILQKMSKSFDIPCSVLLNDKKKGKKQALNLGINSACFDWIALTDADCIVPENWLKTHHKSQITNHKSLIACARSEITNPNSELRIPNSELRTPNSELRTPNSEFQMYIGYSPEIYKNTWQYFKQLATATNYAASTYAGIPISCTGRNLIFEKKAFFEVNGYEGLYEYQSGDDKLLLKRFLEHKKKVSYMPYPAIYTQASEGDSLKNQNIRRYGKFSMSSIGWKIAMVFLGLCFLMIPIEMISVFKPIGDWHYGLLGDWHYKWLYLLIYFLSINTYLLLGCILHREKLRFLYFIYGLVFPYYLIFQMTYSSFKKWKWK